METTQVERARATAPEAEQVPTRDEAAPQGSAAAPWDEGEGAAASFAAEGDVQREGEPEPAADDMRNSAGPEPAVGGAREGAAPDFPGGRDERLAQLSPQELGKLGEDIACLYLGQRGYEVLMRNWRCFGGEADVVAALDGAVVLVEVKTRRSDAEARAVYPEEAVDERKRARYRRIAQCYLAEHPEARSLRFDVIAVLVIDGSHAHVHHVCGAFGWDERA